MKYSSRIVLVIASMMIPNALLSVVAFMKAQNDIAILFAVLFMVGAIANAVLLRQLRETVGEQQENVVSIRRFNFDTFSHILSYVPALLAISIDFSGVGTALVTFYIFYLAIIAITDVVTLNPFLHICGWRFQPATLSFDLGTEEIVVITPPGTQLAVGHRNLAQLTDFGMYLLRDDGRSKEN